jgi:outer membrane protein assembly factor BamB
MGNAWRMAPCLYLNSMNLAKQNWFQMHGRGVVMTAREILMNGWSLLRPLSSVFGTSLSAGFVMLALSACSESELILDGDRVAIITTSDIIAADPAALAEGAGLPDAIDILNASHPGLSAGHTGGNVKASLPFKRVWRASIGGSGDSLTELAQPMVAGEQVFTVAPNGTVTAFDIKTGNANWQVSVEEFTDNPLPGIAGGLAVRGGTLFVHAGGRNLTALSVQDGSTIWSISLRFPVRGGPTIIGQEAVAVTDLDGNVFAYSTNDGSVFWERAGLPVNTVVYGAPSPAFANDQLAVAGYGGDVSLLEANSGQIIWSDSLAAFSPRTPLQKLGDIRAHPVFDGGLIFAVSQAGQIAAFNARSGLFIWDQPIGGIEMPWVAGKSLFLQTIDGRLYALRRSDGAVRWVTDLPGALPKGVVAPEEIPRYVGPVVVDGKVLVISKSGSLFAFDANTGDGGKTIDVGSDVVTAPQLASGLMFVLSGNGTLTAFE